MDQVLQQVTGLAAPSWQLPTGLHVSLTWVVVAAATLGFLVGAIQLAGWAAAYFAAVVGAGLLAPTAAALLRQWGAGNVVADWPWAALVLPGCAVAAVALVGAAIARRALQLVGLGILDRCAGAAVGVLAASGGIASFSWVASRLAAIAAMVHV